MDYLTVQQTAEKWGISVRQVQALLKDNRIKGAQRFGNHAWMIPADAQKPGDPRRESPASQKAPLSDFNDFMTAAISSMKFDDPDTTLTLIKEKCMRLHLEAYIAYYRGDFERAKQCFQKMQGHETARFCTCAIAIAAAISTGDYPLFKEIETYLKRLIELDISTSITTIAEGVLSSAYLGALAPNMVVSWLKDGDFSALPPDLRAEASYQRAKYFQSIGNYEAMLTVAQTTLAFCDSVIAESYLRLLCAIAFYKLGRSDEANYCLSNALKAALPHGYITPFAEALSNLGGQLERLLEREYPEYHDPIIEQCKRKVVNWITFHNRFTKDNITTILSLREGQIAQLVVQGVPYKKIAGQFNISVGRLKNIVHEIYGKLFVGNRKELAQYIL